VRCDVLTPGGSVLGSAGLLQTLFTTTPNDPAVQLVVKTGIDLSAYKGQTVRLRFAAANNQGKLIVGVDNVRLNVQFTDTTGPLLAGAPRRWPLVLALVILLPPLLLPLRRGRGTIHRRPARDRLGARRRLSSY